MSSGRILLSLFCEQLSPHPAPSGASLLDTGSAWRFSVRESSRARCSAACSCSYALRDDSIACWGSASSMPQSSRPFVLPTCPSAVLSYHAPPGHVHISWPNASVFVPSPKQSASLLFVGCAHHAALFGFMLLDFRLRTGDLAVVAPMVLFGCGIPCRPALHPVLRCDQLAACENLRFAELI